MDRTGQGRRPAREGRRTGCGSVTCAIDVASDREYATIRCARGRGWVLWRLGVSAPTLRTENATGSRPDAACHAIPEQPAQTHATQRLQGPHREVCERATPSEV